jgi:FkbM family methyltransferase
MFIPCVPDEAIACIEYYNDGTNNDKWVVQDIFNYKKNGYFIEAGARDGVVGSSTYALEKYLGWTGLLVEPTEDYHQCVVNRTGSVCRQIVLSGKNGYDIFVHSNAMPLSGIKRNLLFMEKEYERRTNGRYVKNEYRTSLGVHSEQLVETLTLERLLDQVNAPGTIDYLALDVEGSEYDILSHFNFDRYKIMALAIEDDLCNELLVSRGYIKVDNWHNKKQKWEQYFLHPDLYQKLKQRLQAAPPLLE